MLSAIQRDRWLIILRASSVFALNLPVPLLLGHWITSNGGKLGMAAAIALCGLTLVAICLINQRIERTIVSGGLVVACSQFLPILQIMSGIFGIWVWVLITGDSGQQSADEIRLLVSGDREDAPFTTEVFGFAVTLFTAQPLLLATLIIGGGIRVLFGSDAVHTAESADYDENVLATAAASIIAPKPETM